MVIPSGFIYNQTRGYKFMKIKSVFLSALLIGSLSSCGAEEAPSAVAPLKSNPFDVYLEISEEDYFAAMKSFEYNVSKAYNFLGHLVYDDNNYEGLPYHFTADVLSYTYSTNLATLSRQYEFEFVKNSAVGAYPSYFKKYIEEDDYTLGWYAVPVGGNEHSPSNVTTKKFYKAGEELYAYYYEYPINGVINGSENGISFEAKLADKYGLVQRYVWGTMVNGSITEYENQTLTWEKVMAD